MSISKYWRASLPLLTVMMLAPLANADDSKAPAKTGSDYNPKKLRFEIGRGSIDVRDNQTGLTFGGWQDNRGQQGLHVRLNLEQKYLLGNGAKIDEKGSAGVMVNPGIHASIDGHIEDQRVKIDRASADLKGFSALRGQALDIQQVQVYSISAATDMKEYRITKTETRSCSVHLKNYYSDDYYFENGTPEDCTRGYNDQYLTKEQLQEVRYKNYTVYTMTNAPTATSEFELGSINGVYRKNSFNGTEVIAGRGMLASVDGHVAFKVNDLQMDLCLGASPINIILGKAVINGEQSKTALSSNVHGCAGVQLGEVGRLGYDVDYEYMRNGHSQHVVAQTVSLAHQKHLPVTLGATHVLEFSNNENIKARGTTLVTIGSAF